MSPFDQYSPLHILLAVDSSEHTRAAVQLLCYLPLPPGSRVIAAGVVASHQQSGQEELSAILSEIQLRLKNKVRTTTECLSGHPVRALIEVATGCRADLIVIGANGLRKVLGLLLDGVAQQVVEVANRPVLVARSPCRGLRRVLLTVEGSLSNRTAVNCLTQFSLPARTEIRVMHVLPPRYASVSYPFTFPAVSEGLPPPIITQNAAEAMEEEIAYKESEARAILTQTVNTLRLAGKTATSILTRGDAATEIVEYSQTQAIDLIVTGSRGLGRVEGWLKGSVSRQLIHSAGCSVLVVRDDRYVEKNEILEREI